MSKIRVVQKQLVHFWGKNKNRAHCLCVNTSTILLQLIEMSHLVLADTFHVQCCPMPILTTDVQIWHDMEYQQWIQVNSDYVLALIPFQWISNSTNGILITFKCVNCSIDVLFIFKNINFNANFRGAANFSHQNTNLIIQNIFSQWERKYPYE